MIYRLFPFDIDVRPVEPGTPERHPVMVRAFEINGADALTITKRLQNVPGFVPERGVFVTRRRSDDLNVTYYFRFMIDVPMGPARALIQRSLAA